MIFAGTEVRSFSSHEEIRIDPKTVWCRCFKKIYFYIIISVPVQNPNRSRDPCDFNQRIGDNLTLFWTVKALRIFSYGILILSRGLISDDIKRIEKVVPGMLTGNRFGGFATPLGAVIFFQELLLYLTMYQKPPSRLPDLWPVIISALSCGVFILFYIRMVFNSRDSCTGRFMDGLSVWYKTHKVIWYSWQQNWLSHRREN